MRQGFLQLWIIAQQQKGFVDAVVKIDDAVDFELAFIEVINPPKNLAIITGRKLTAAGEDVFGSQ